MKKELVGQRGKTAEKMVEDLFKRWNGKTAFAFHRLNDARAAGGRLGANPADFIYFTPTHGGFLEVKSTRHPCRLTRTAVSQLPTLQKFSHAGAQNLILVYHSELNVWRILYPGGLPTDIPSWDLSEVPTYATAEDALQATGYFNGL